MEQGKIRPLLEKQRDFFERGETRSLDFRLAQLRRLKQSIKDMEEEIFAALAQDLHKSSFESFASEVGLVYEEIRLTLKSLSDWIRPERVTTPLICQPASSRVYPQPKGVVLIIGPWNYPFQLVVAPLIGAIAAGNCAVLKPSEIAPATSAVLRKLIEKAFPREQCAVVEGGVEATEALLRERFDHIFFTGSIPVGRIVMRAAAEHLTPVTLELGGKSPCIVDKDTDLAVTAKRIAWGKYFNAGQTCIAPDYLLAPRSIKNELLAEIQKNIEGFFGADPRSSPDYGRIVSGRHFARLSAFLTGDIYTGGESDQALRYIAPTVIDNVTLAAPVMADEIFGPILPVITYDDLDEALAVVRQRPNPLALYLFTNSKKVEKHVVESVPFGGGCINGALVHLANPHLPFGGVGASGMGAYHGYASFSTFSHFKSVMKTPFALDLPLRYPPYGKRLGLLRKLMR